MPLPTPAGVAFGQISASERAGGPEDAGPRGGHRQEPLAPAPLRAHRQVHRVPDLGARGRSPPPPPRPPAPAPAPAPSPGRSEGGPGSPPADRRRAQVLLKGDRELVGTLKGFDMYVNMVLEDVTE